MIDKILEVGVASHSGVPHTDGHSNEELVRHLVQRAVQLPLRGGLPVRLAVALATAPWCTEALHLPARIRQEMRSSLGYDVPLIGGSMAGIYCSSEPDQFIRNGLLLLLISSEHLWATVDHSEPLDISSSERPNHLRLLADRIDRNSGVHISATSSRSVLAIFPGFRIRDGRREYADHELHAELLRSFDYRYSVFGASAANAAPSTAGYQFANDYCTENGLAISLIETDLIAFQHLHHGLQPARCDAIVVDELQDRSPSSNRARIIGGTDAQSYLSSLVDGKLDLQRPPMFGRPHPPDHDIIFPIGTETSGAVVLNRQVSIGDRLIPMKADPLMLLHSTQNTFDATIGPAVTEETLSLLFGFSCTGYFRWVSDYEQRWTSHLQQLATEHPAVPVIVGLSAGEFGMDNQRQPRSNQMSVTIASLHNRISERAKPREVYRRLLEATEQLFKRQTPKEVMIAALTYAAEAGSTGGQICILDPALERIINYGHGASYQPPHSEQKWESVAEQTVLPLPASHDTRLPFYLRDHSYPLLSKLAESLTSNPVLNGAEEEDILTLITRTIRAIFIADPLDKKYHCNKIIAQSGNIKEFLAVPLLGSNQHIIATMQLSFPSGTRFSCEDFQVWVGYAQKVAAALENAQASKERERIRELHKLRTQVQTDFEQAATLTIDEALKRYLAGVQDLLGVDYAHMRIREITFGGGGFRFLAPDSRLAHIHMSTRPILDETTGGWHPDQVPPTGRNSKTRAEVSSFLTDLTALENKELEPALLREFRKFGSQATFPVLHHNGDLLGFIGFHSKREWYFDSSRYRIASAATETTATLIQVLRSVELRRRYERYRHVTHFAQSQLLLHPSSLSDHGDTTWLDQILTRTSREISADWAAIYAWHDDAARLVLYAAHGWHAMSTEPPSYAQREGWVGHVFDTTDEVTAVSPGTATASHVTDRYRDLIEPPEERSERDCEVYRVSTKLILGEKSVGLAVFGFYPRHRDSLNRIDALTKDFLSDLGRIIAGGIGRASKRERQDRITQIRRAKDVIAEQLANTHISTDDLDDEPQPWTKVLQAVVNGFGVESAILHKFSAGKLETTWAVPYTETLKVDRHRGVYELYRDLIVQKKPLLVKDATKTPMPALGPQGIKSFYAVPLLSRDGELRGILNLVNRRPTSCHPFQFLDAEEINEANDLARMLGQVISLRDGDNYRRTLHAKLETATRIGAHNLLSGIVLHELSAPLAIIQQSIDILRNNEGSHDYDRERIYARIERSGRRAVEILSGAVIRGPEIRKATKISTLVKEALRIVEREIPLDRVRLHIDNSVSFESKVDTYTIVGALVNLLDNAIEAIPPGEAGTVTVATSLAKEGGKAIIRIHNPGPPLDAGEIKRLFAAGHTSKNEPGHMGLGLPLAKAAVEAEGGDIRMTGGDDGVTVQVILPITGVSNGAKPSVIVEDERIRI